MFNYRTGCRVGASTVLLCVMIFAFASSTEARIPEFRSAFLRADVWTDGLSSKQVNEQLQRHFTSVLETLESHHASSLLLALRRAEAVSAKAWTRSQRRHALIELVKNRQTQINRLRTYAQRGLFPLNEGQAPAAVPIFVDQHKTHCAVGYLMHRDGQDQQVAEIVSQNNLVRVMDVQGGGLIDWVRTSGLTREEAALIQPGYPIGVDAFLGELQTTKPVVNELDYTLSNTVIKHIAMEPPPILAPGDPVPIFWQIGRNMLDDPATPVSEALDDNGIKFGTGQFQLGTFNAQSEPNNLQDWLYAGAAEIGFGSITSGLTPTAFTETLQLFSLDYRIRSNKGNFTKFALTSGLINGNNVDEFGALRILSEIYDGTSNQLLGSVELSARNGTVSLTDSSLQQVDSIDLNSSNLQIKTYGMSLGERSFINSLFYEFETAAVPEPGCTLLVLGMLGIGIRSRRG